MDNNLIKNEAKVELNKTENQNENQAVILTKKFKNTGALTINQIYVSAQNDYEKLKLIESEYIKLQHDFYELKKDFINYIEKDEWSEVLLGINQLSKIIETLNENKIKYKTKVVNNTNILKVSIKGENLEKIWNKILLNG